MRKDKFKKKNLIIIILFIISVSIMCFSIYKIFIFNNENNKTEKLLEHLKEIATIKEDTKIENTKKEDIISEDYDDTVEPLNPFWQYSEMNSKYIDFSELKTINKKTVGWINVKGTNVNLPFVQTSDNKYYLTHSFDNSYNSSGWAFLDYRNSNKIIDKNNIIYAHGRKNGSMFGSLRNLLKKDWQKNTNNYTINIITEKENSLWRIFSVYYIPTTNDYIRVDFTSDNEFSSFINMIKERSMFDFKTDVNESDKILTLSTCYSEKDKLVVHAKLIKKD